MNTFLKIVLYVKYALIHLLLSITFLYQKIRKKLVIDPKVTQALPVHQFHQP